MKGKKQSYSAALLLAGLMIFYSCDEFITVNDPPHLIVKDRVFEDERSANAAVLALYSDLSGVTSYLNGNMQVMAALNAHELSFAGNDINFMDFMESNILPNNGAIASLWNELYHCIYGANSIMEGLAGSATLPTATIERLRGEALLIRGLCYQYLVGLYGDVPLITETAFEVNQSKGRATSEAVYNLIFADLSEAWNLLPVEKVAPERTRPDRHAAAALLARAYLYGADWPKAEQFANAVISSGQYIPVRPDSAFLKSSNATIFQLKPVYSSSAYNNTNIGRILIPANSTVIPTFYVNEELLEAFESGDRRKTDWLGVNRVNGVDYHYPFKYRARFTEQVKEYFVLFRLAEVLLIRAEARLRQGEMAGAVSDLNIIRRVAELPDLPTALSRDEVMEAIRQERRIELAFEWGHLWLDLKRWGLADAVLGTLKGNNWSPTDTLWPIPFDQLQANPFLSQNDGYGN